MADRLRAALGATLTVHYSKALIVVGLVAAVLGFVANILGWLMVSAICSGALCGMPLYMGLTWLTEWRWRRATRNWPVRVEVTPGPDGERVAFVTFAGGGVISLVIPDDYDPEDDDGRWLIEQVSPDLASKLFDD